MLVGQLEAVGAEGVAGAFGRERVEFCDQALAAAGIAGDSIDGDRRRSRHKACADQRRHQADEAGGIAAGIGNALRALDQHAVAVGHLGEAIDPMRIDAMRGRSVNDDGMRIGDKLHGFLR